MRQLISILIGTTLLFSCGKQRESIEKFLFDRRQVTSRTIHNYEFYRDGKIKVDNSITYYSQAGLAFDSVSQQEHFTYNTAGKLESTFDPTDSSKRLYIYNEIDSLVGDFSINQFGDTIFLAISDYKHGKEVRRINRMLGGKILEHMGNIRREDLRKYDTLLYVTEFVYNGDRLEKTISKDKQGNISGEVHTIYKDGKRAKALTYSFLGDEKYLRETTEYSDTDSNEPDYIATNPQGVTVGYRKTVFQDNMKIVAYYMGEFDTQSILYYNEKGLLIGSVEIDRTERTRDVYSYTYDDKGHKIEEANYKERLSNAR